MTKPEFSYPVRLDTLGAAPRSLSIAADEGARAALARRFGLVGIDRLEAAIEAWRDTTGPMATIRVSADVVQACIATGDSLPARIDSAARLRFLPIEESIEGAEIELDADECDSVFYEGSAIDLGEAAAETMALEINPFPRSPDAEAALRAAGVVGEDEIGNGAFDALKALRGKLEGKA